MGTADPGADDLRAVLGPAKGVVVKKAPQYVFVEVAGKDVTTAMDAILPPLQNFDPAIATTACALMACWLAMGRCPNPKEAVDFLGQFALWVMRDQEKQ